MVDHVEDGTEYLYAQFSEEDGLNIEKRTELFNNLASDFSCEVGKVGYKTLY